MTPRPNRMPAAICLVVFAGCGRPQLARHDSAALSASWQYLGPTNDLDHGSPLSAQAGRVNDIAFDPSTPGVLYAATAKGGLWQSTNGGTNWTALSDGWPTNDTSAVAVSNGNVYVGTGSYNDVVPIHYNGLMVAKAGVWSWTTFQLGTATGIRKILADPDQPGNVIVATDAGLWRSGIAGWNPVTLSTSCPHNADPHFIDLAFGARNSDGSRYLYAWGENDTGDIWRSADHGATWKLLPSPLHGGGQGSGSRIAASPSVASNFYLISVPDNVVWMNTAAGGTPYENGPNDTNCARAPVGWQQIPLTYNLATQEPAIGVGSTTANGGTDVIYIGTIGLTQSVGGQHFPTALLNVHDDQHALVVNPRDFTNVLNGNDGGINSLNYTAGGTINIGNLSATLGDAEVYTVAISKQNQSLVLAGMQDTAGGYSAGNFSSWVNAYGQGDFSATVIDPTNSNIQYASVNWSDRGQRNVYQTFDAWQTQPPRFIMPSNLFAGDAGSGPEGRSTKLDPVNPSYLFVATAQYLYRGYVGNPDANPIWSFALGGQRLTATIAGNITDFAIGSDDARIYTVAFDGSVFMSTNQGATWSNISANLPSVGLGAVSINPNNVDDVLVGGGFRDKSGGVWRCTAPAANPPVWTKVTPPLGAIYSLARDPGDPANQWYAGGDSGVFFTADAGAHWEDITRPRGLPVTSVRDLEVVGTNLYAGTYGRGVWRVALGCAPTTCQPSQCGIISDGCGGSFDCGGCPSGSQCISNNYCCMPLTCASAGFTCGTLLDGCGHTLSCGGCPSGQACVDNTCCAHVRCFLGACHCLS